MAIDVAVETTIERPPADVFAAIADLDTWPTWLIASGIVSVQRDRSGPAVAGERLVVEQNAAGRAGTFDVQVGTVDPGSRFALQGRDADGVTIAIDAGISPTPDAEDRSTELRWSIRIGLPLRYRVLESMARPQVERAAVLDVEALRRTLEAQARD
jgi:uncharacterized protein YndB with AHSA1/START domain